MPRYKKRADGRYQTNVRIGTQPNGKPKYKTLYARSQTELERKVRDIKHNIDKGIMVDDKNLTVGEWAYKWLSIYKANLRENTRAMYEVCVRNSFAPIENIRLSSLTSADVQNALNLLSDKPRSQQVFLLTIRQVLKKAIDNKYIYINVADSIKPPKKHKPVKRALTNTEVKDIFSLPLPESTFIFISLMLYCGLRRGEAWGLSLKDIDFKKNVIHVTRAAIYSKDKKGTVVGKPKTEASIRDVPIPNVFLNRLKTYVETHKNFYLFTYNDKIYTEWRLQHIWKEFINIYNRSKGGNDKLKVIAPDITPHIFRHTYATSLYKAGVDIKTAQYLLGHTDIKVTMDIYTHLDDSLKKNATSKLNDFYGSNSTITENNLVKI